jgi:predicted transcriptional regulator
MVADDVGATCYAPDRMPVGMYRLVVFHSGPLPEQEALMNEQLTKASYQHNSAANYMVESIDVNQPIPQSFQSLWQSFDSPDAPRLVVLYPENARYQGIVWSGPLTSQTVQAVLTSPVRREIATRLMNGHAAVWVLLESGDRVRDEEAAQFLEKEIGFMNQKIASQTGTSEDLQNKAFSILRLSRSNPEEYVFINMLMYCEPGLFEFQSYPMVFPVFGRGKILYALAGAGINTMTVRLAGSTVTAPSICQVDDLDTSTDLLLSVDWEADVLSDLF